MTNSNQGPMKPRTDKVEKYEQNMDKAASRRQLQSASKKLRRNLKPKGPRDNDLSLDALDNWDELDYTGRERVMPLDESDRRRAVEQAAFRAPGSIGTAAETGSPVAEGPRGLVVAVGSGLCHVELEGRTLLCRLRGALSSLETEFTNAIAVGDEVAVREDGAGAGIVEAVLPRRSALTRPDVFLPHRQQLIAANAHQLLIVSSWREPAIWLELIDRYLIAAERSRLLPIICVNKVDLVEDEADFEATLITYRTLGYQLIATSALSGAGIAELRFALSNRTTVLAGLSGTGKSSLVAAVQPGLKLRTAEVSEHSGQGRHTTTQATLLRLETGGFIVDTPGIREFGLSGLRRHELAGFFQEFAPLLEGCRFKDCSHLAEPDCAVQAALAAGAIAASRYHSYRQIYATL